MDNETLLQQLPLGGTTAGFRLEKRETAEQLHATAYTLTHIQTGAQLFYLDRPDENKTFCIAFPTLPEDSTGVFHILEHSVLNGSERYPVKEPFVSLLQSSMQTFLNAMTYPDKTVYPVSSRNEQDFRNLMAVYLDAVFCPMIHKKPEIFMQEGWHYEFDPETGEPFFNGVVYSEMKGAYADVERILDDGVNTLLFPDTCYGYSSGGHPAHIPELTYEKFTATHKRFYHPSHAKIFLDGHMDIGWVLSYLDSEYLGKYQYRPADYTFAEQSPRTGELTVTYEAQSEEELAHMSVARLLCRWDEPEKLYAAHVLADYLTGSNEAPLTRAVLEQGLGQDVGLSIMESMYQLGAVVTVRNTRPEDFSAIRALLPAVAEECLRQGLDRQSLLASLERLAFTSREITEPYGIDLAMKALDSWLYGGDPLTHIQTGALFAQLQEKLDSGYFEALLREMLCDPSDKVYVYALPSLTKGQEDARREAELAAAHAAGWSEAEAAQHRASLLSMQAWQQTPDSEEAIRTLPVLKLADVAREIPEVATEQCTCGGCPVLKTQVPTNGILYLDLYFDISDLPVEKLQAVNLLISCLGELRTEKTSAQELLIRSKSLFGHLSGGIKLVGKNGDLDFCKPYLKVSAAMLEDNFQPGVALLQEILCLGRYDEIQRITPIVLQSDYFQKQSLYGNGHRFSMTRALSGFSAESTLEEQLNGETYIRWCSALAQTLPQEGEALSQTLHSLADTVFSSGRLLIGISANAPEAVLLPLVEALPSAPMGKSLTYDRLPAENGTIDIPGGMGYSAIGHNLYALGSEFTGAWSVLSSMLSYGYLWNAVRIQGGAYGTGMLARNNGDLMCYSYRDPDLRNSRDAFSALADSLEEALAQGISLDELIIGTVNTTDPLLEPAAVCSRTCERFLRGSTHEDMVRIRQQLLDTTPETLGSLIPVLRKFQQEAVYCAAGDTTALSFLQ